MNRLLSCVHSWAPGKLWMVAAVFLLVSGAAELQADEPDYSIYARILKNNTYSCKRQGIRLRCVRYARLRKSAEWKRVVALFANYDARKLKTYHERLAFYINAYNVLAIQTIVNRPTSSINKIPGVWKKRAGRVAGRYYSLDGLEKGVIKRYGDPRFHFALVCAALSCPDIRHEPYRGKILSRQLGSQTYRFLRNRSKGLRYNRGSRTVRLSKLFEWYKADFKRYGSVMRFVRRYRKDVPASVKIGPAIPYNWALNR